MTGTLQQPLVLRAGEASVTLEPSFGGMINGLVLPTPAGPREVIAGVDRAECATNPGYRGVALFPFPNRLRDGYYRFSGREYRFEINEPATHNALHGFLYRTAARVEQGPGLAGASTARLVYAFDASDPGYPFKAEVRMDYALWAKGELQVTMTAINRDECDIPVGLGWHPYYTLGMSLEECRLSLPAVRRTLVDERMLPTGEQCEDLRFTDGAPLSGVELDDCFALAQQSGSASARFSSQAAGFGLELWQHCGASGMNFMQVYTSPDRKSLAVEPMSCGIDAFNTGEGLAILEPGQVFSGVFGARAYGL